jgi:BolA family transcriptional regulator, general stress-responsive regulator
MHDTNTPAPTVERIRNRLMIALAPLRMDVQDESAAHAGHAGARSGGGHYRVYLVSDRFAGLTRVARHRLVYDALEDLMQRDVHALALLLVTPDEAGGSNPEPNSGIQGS